MRDGDGVWERIMWEKKTHCRMNGIKGGVVMNKNANTSIFIVSLSRICIALQSHSHCHSYAQLSNPHFYYCCCFVTHFVTFNELFAIFRSNDQKTKPIIQNELVLGLCFSFRRAFFSFSDVHIYAPLDLSKGTPFFASLGIVSYAIELFFFSHLFCILFFWLLKWERE